MNQTEIIEVVRESILLSLQIGAPPMMIGLVVGVIIALFQALTQIQEITLVFVPKIMAIFLSMFIVLPWMLNVLVVFMQDLSVRMIGG